MRTSTFMTSEYSRFDSANQESLMTSILLHSFSPHAPIMMIS